MKVTVYNAISIDGYIAKLDGDSDWVAQADIPYFEAEINKAGCIVIGRKTYEQFAGQLYPVKDVLNIVLTTNKELKLDGAEICQTPEQAIALAQSKGYENILLVGGGTVNGAFYNAGLVDEIIVDIHPLILGKGIKIFENTEIKNDFELVSEQKIEAGLILVKYQKTKQKA